jgi:hypothetical protein
MTTTQLADQPTIGSTVIDADGESWKRDESGWRQVGVFGLLGDSVFTWGQLNQGMGPLYF